MSSPLTPDIFDFGDLALLGNLRWVQEEIGDPNLSEVIVRTRTGRDAQPIQYNKVRPGERIFRVGGGAQSGNRSGTTSNSDEVPWKWADEVADADLKIRGPGEMLGKAQSGLDGLKLGDLISDTDLVRKAQALAANLISEDPLLKNPKNQRLRLLVDNIGQNNDLIA